MAQKVSILFVDDLDGSEAKETVSFGLDGSTYEIDLSSANASKLRKELAQYAEHARRTTLPRGRRHQGRPTTRKSRAPLKETRVKAIALGYQVGDRGRISEHIADAVARGVRNPDAPVVKAAARTRPPVPA